MADLRCAPGPYRGYDLGPIPKEDEELTHVGPQTPGGEYFRRFWQPVAMSSQLGEFPVPIRILEEDLVVFRDGGGRVGLLHRHCAHRRASLEYGRIENRGIRCCYHGWHYDVDGTLLEAPGEPADTPLTKRVCQGAYPVKELHGLVFAYMGPAGDVPEFPYLDSMGIADHDLVPYSIHSPSNWLQESENAMDPHHSVFLHGRVNGPQFPGLENFVELPVVVYHEIATGFVYSHARRVDDLVWVRFHDHLTPTFAQNGGMFQKMNAPKFFGRPSLSKWVVPLDNTNTRKFGWRHFNDTDEALRQGKRDAVGWESVDFYGQTGHRTDDEKHRNPGDWEAWVGQGPINVHAHENLGTTDKGVALLRRRLRKDIRAVRDGQSIPRPTGTPEKPVHTYGGDTIVRRRKRTDGDETTVLEDIQKKIAEVYFSGDDYEGDDRVEYLRRELAKLSED